MKLIDVTEKTIFIFYFYFNNIRYIIYLL